MRILALNIRSGGGLRVEGMLRYIRQQDPDTIVLTEWRNNLFGGKISCWARDCGMHSVNCTDGKTANGVFVASKFPLAGTSERPAKPGPGVLLQTECGGLGLLACYFPQGTAKVEFFRKCMGIASDYVDKPFILLGDLNTGNQVADKDVAGASYYCAEWFDKLSSQGGLFDLWRLSNGRDAREWTWISNGGNGFRIDHAFANDAFIKRGRPTCRYDHEPRHARLTDHSLIVVDYLEAGFTKN